MMATSWVWLSASAATIRPRPVSDVEVALAAAMPERRRAERQLGGQRRWRGPRRSACEDDAVGETAGLLERVALILQEVSAEVIEPRFRALVDTDVRSKSPGEVVTVADLEAEARLTSRLGDLLAGVPIVGEEACAVTPALAGALEGDQAWLVDPLDGTANFVAGSPDWAVMVALVDHGTTVAAWIWRPMERVMYLAERGAGATRNGARLHRPPAPPAAQDLRGTVLGRFLDAPTRAAVARNTGRFRDVTGGTGCAGVEYPAVLEGVRDFVLFWRTLPWDHAPGSLLAQEAGATVRRLDRSAYRPAQTTAGLLIAAGGDAWDAAAQLVR